MNVLSNSIALIAIHICICALCTLSANGEDEFDGQLNLQLQHSFDLGPTPEFVSRGSVTLRSLRKGDVNLQQPSLSEEDRVKLQKLADSNGVYRIRVPTKSNSELRYLSTFVKACALYESRLSDTLTLHTDSAGELVGISASVAQPQCQGNNIPASLLRSFNTVVDVRVMESGPAPDTTAFLQKLDREKADKTKNEQADNRSFFAKYWMYILPVVVFVFISGIANNDGQGGGGGR